MRTVQLLALLILTGAVPALGGPRDYLKKPDDWFHSADGRARLANVLSHQDEAGCWPKNLDTTKMRYLGRRKDVKGTFDNSATIHELRLLARAHRLTGKVGYKDAFQRGLKCVLDAQYKNGGWPQRPIATGYSQHITFNDNTMIGLMTFLREVSASDDYKLVAHKSRAQASEAVKRGVQCILKCQIVAEGKLTVWCAQHDRESLEPRGARSYEHPSLSGSESAGIVLFLMSLEEPSDGIRRSVGRAVEWFDRAKLTGIRVAKVDGDRRIVQDSKAPPLWARFYEIKTNRPIFSGRDGVIKYSLSEIEAERRNGYSWYGNSGQRVAAAWAKWKWK